MSLEVSLDGTIEELSYTLLTEGICNQRKGTHPEKDSLAIPEGMGVLSAGSFLAVKAKQLYKKGGTFCSLLETYTIHLGNMVYYREN